MQLRTLFASPQPCTAICVLALVVASASGVVVSAQGAQALSTEELALRAQVETMRAYQEQFLSVVEWSLGIVAAMALGLSAFSWYTNKTNYERDREALRQERENLRQESKTQLTEEMRRVSDQLAAAMSSRQGEIEKAVEKGVATKLAKLTEQVCVLASDVLDLTSEMVEQQAKQSIKDGNHNWALYKYCEHLHLSVKRSADHYEVNETLDSIKKILNTAGLKLHADDVTNTVETLKRLPRRYHAASDALIERVNQGAAGVASA